MYYALSGLDADLAFNQGRRARFARACPWLSYFAPLALFTAFLIKIDLLTPHSSAICRRVTDAGGKRNEMAPLVTATWSLRGCTAFGFSNELCA